MVLKTLSSYNNYTTLAQSMEFFSENRCEEEIADVS
jgi:hypothetical protein